MKRAVLTAGIAGALLAAPAAGWAHHSHAMFDTSKEEVIAGTVKNFAFANPHVYLFIVTPGDGGKTRTYAIEMSFVQNMERQGMSATTFAPGDKVSVKVNPLRDGRPGGSYTGAIDAKGHKYGSMAG